MMKTHPRRCSSLVKALTGTGVGLSLVMAAAPARSDVLLQGFYWDVPSPAAGQEDAPWWWDRLAEQAHELRAAGFTAVWIPPVLKSHSGGYSVGYDPFDDYDLGSKLQMGTLPTRYGTREQLQRACAVMRANGFSIYADLVQNHRNGDDGNFRFVYKDAYGNPAGGRFPKGPEDFHPNVPQDPGVPDAGEDVRMFGRDVAHVNGRGRYAWTALNRAGDWLTRALDLQGYRLDYVKGISTVWLHDFLQYGAMRGKFAVGEYYDSNLGDVSRWVTTGMKGRATAFDFPLRDLLKEMCNTPKAFDMARLDHAGLAGVMPEQAVTFAENHDTDRSDPIVTNKALAYAYLLTSEGYPTVFYRDYSTDPNCYGMKPVIDPLLWIHEKLANGPTQPRWKDRSAFVYERLGKGDGKRLLVGMNSDPDSARTITVATGFGPKARLHDYAGHGPDLVTDAQGQATITIPPNKDGRSYVCYARPGVTGGFTSPPTATTQVYRGARDLDLRPVETGEWVTVCRVYAAAGRPLIGSLTFDDTGWAVGTRIALELAGPSSKPARREYRADTPQGTILRGKAARTGWHTWRIRAFDTPPQNRTPGYALAVTYTAPQKL